MPPRRDLHFNVGLTAIKYPLHASRVEQWTVAQQTPAARLGIDQHNVALQILCVFKLLLTLFALHLSTLRG